MELFDFVGWASAIMVVIFMIILLIKISIDIFKL
jgi:hypothetical protein